MANRDIATRAQALTLRVSGTSDEEILRQTGIEAKIVDRLLTRAIERGFHPQSQHPIIRDCFVKDQLDRRSHTQVNKHSAAPPILRN